MTTLAAEFEALRPYLRRVAYGVLGTLSEADDVVQEAWLRLQRVDRDEIEDLRAWLAQVVSRLALDVLGSARVRREAYVGPWLPEPVVEELGPEDRVTLDESVSMALMVVLERLSPAERTAFVLHDVFGYSFAEVGAVVGRTDSAVRQLASRARRHVETSGARFAAPADEHARVLAAFVAAVTDGTAEDLAAVLDPEVVLHSDGGGAVTAARKPLAGAARVARTLIAFRENGPGTYAGRIALVNGAPGLIIEEPGGPLSVFSITVRESRVVRVDIVRNPAKLAGVHREAP